MENILWTCTYCNKIPDAQSRRKCPICGRKLTPWDRSKDPIERQPEWPPKKEKSQSDLVKSDNYIDYTKFYKNKDNNESKQ